MKAYKGKPNHSLLGPAIRIASEHTGKRARLGLAVGKKKYSFEGTPYSSLDSAIDNVIRDVSVTLKTDHLADRMNTIIAHAKKSGYRSVDTTSPEFRDFWAKANKEKDPTKLEGEIIRFFKITKPEDIKFIRELLKAVKIAQAHQKELKTASEGASSIAVRKGTLYFRKRPVSVVEGVFRKLIGREVTNLK